MPQGYSSNVKSAIVILQGKNIHEPNESQDTLDFKTSSFSQGIHTFVEQTLMTMCTPHMMIITKGYGKIFKHENIRKYFYSYTVTFFLSINFTLILNTFYSLFQIDIDYYYIFLYRFMGYPSTPPRSKKNT